MRNILLLVFVVVSSSCLGQTDGVLIDYVGTTRDNSAVLDVRSSNQGVMVPRMTLSARDLISNPAKSLLIFQTDNDPGYYYNSGTPASPQWIRLYDSDGNNISGSGTATQVAFWNGTYSLTGNSNLYWNNTNIRLGIGTSSPARNLHVESGGQISLLQGTSVAQNSTAGIYWHTGSDYAIYRTSGAWNAPDYQQLMLMWGTGVIIDPGTAYGKSYLEVQGNGIRVTSGTIGIGLTAPTRPLSFANSVGEKLSLYSQSAAARDYYGFAIESNTLAYQVPSAQRHVWYEGSSERMRLASGNLGIGTNNPGYKLEVIGNTRTSGNFYGHLHVDDTRNVNDAPNVFNYEVAFDFKLRSTVGVPGSGGYSGMMTIAPWGDNSGDASHQMNFNEGGIFWRQGQPDATSWDAWQQVVTKDPSAPTPGACYTRWGQWGCAAGLDEVVQGRTGNQEGFNTNGGYAAANVECVSTSATTNQSWTGFFTRLMRADAQGDGMQHVDSKCSICCSGGCYTALGVNTCATGYSAAYTGRTGTIEGYTSESGYRNKTLCIDDGASVRTTWASGFSTRLMRHRQNNLDAQGMDRVNNVCAVCCKN